MRQRPRQVRRTLLAGSGSTSRTPGRCPATVLADVEHKVNEVLINDLSVTAELMPIDEARAAGAMALFGEKYGDTVRVVSVGDWTRELCGGTHAHRTGQLGVIKLLHESSIGAGVRRIEALVGIDAYRFLAREHTLVGLLTEQLKVPADELPERVAGIVQRLREAEKQIAAAKRAQLATDLAGVATASDRVGDVDLYAFQAPDDLDGVALRDLALATRGKAGQERAAVVLALSVSTMARLPPLPPSTRPGRRPVSPRGTCWLRACPR